MTALQELVKFIEGDIRKGYVDHFLALERRQIFKAYEEGFWAGVNFDEEGRSRVKSPREYYLEKFGEDGKNDPLPPEFWTKDE